MRTSFAYYAGKAVALVSRLSGRGTGITWGGEIALRIDPHFIVNLTRRINNRVLIAGTNGKTTTAALVAHVLSKEHFAVIHNKTGANLLNGIAGTLVKQYGKIASNSICILEADEAAFPEIVKQVKPTMVVLLNLFRDQLDRYGEVDAVAEKWEKVVKKLPAQTTVIANGDDPLIVHIAKAYKGNVLFFGIEEKSHALEKLAYATDSTYCLNCSAKLEYDTVYLSHQGDWHCPRCGERRPALSQSTATSPLVGTYNLYNALAATLAISHFKISRRLIDEHFGTFTPAFGRQERFERNGKKISLFLSKNPTGFNESLRTVLGQKDRGCLLFVLNDRIPDGTDISWIWDVDFEMVASSPIPIICSGDRAYDMGLRLKYADITHEDGRQSLTDASIVESNLNNAVHLGLEKIKKDKTLYILATYSAMLDVRKLLTGKKIA